MGPQTRADRVTLIDTRAPWEAGATTVPTTSTTAGKPTERRAPEPRPRPLGNAADLVLAYLRDNLSTPTPSLPRVARRLGIGQRTLQRRLRLLGTSYQALLDQVRVERYERLRHGGHSAEGLAEALGFGDARALRRWCAAHR